MARRAPLLRAYLRQRGLFARVAKRLGLDPSYVSRVANGERHSKRISLAIETELNKTYAASVKVAQSSRKSPVFHASAKSRTPRSRRPF
jgi:transcriptional regulator with XRE-family HTH domain